MDTDAGDDDPRSVELEALEAIFPEMQRLDNSPSIEKGGRFAFRLQLPVEPAKPVTVVFPAASTQADPAAGKGDAAPVESLLVSHLPPLTVTMALPGGYPEHKGPVVTVSTTPEWLPRDTLVSLEQDGTRLWEEAGRDLVAYTYIDHVQRATEDVFGAIGTGGGLQVDPAHKLAVLDFNINAKKAAFERETFECGICLGTYNEAACC